MIPIFGMVFLALSVVGSIAIWNWLVPKNKGDEYHPYELKSGKVVHIRRKDDGSLVDFNGEKYGEDLDYKRNKTIATILIVVIWIVYFLFTVQFGGDADIEPIH